MVLISFHLLPLYSVFSESHRKTPGGGERGGFFRFKPNRKREKKKTKNPPKFVPFSQAHPLPREIKKTAVAPIHCGNPSYFSHASPPYPKRKAASPNNNVMDFPKRDDRGPNLAPPARDEEEPKIVPHPDTTG